MEYPGVQGGTADKRTDETYWYIAEIISHFDLVAIQEVGKDLGALDVLKQRLGPTWRYVVTDETAGGRGNDERLAFVYDSRKIAFSGVAGELVIGPEEDANGKTIGPSNQLSRTPSIVGFEAGWFRFMLCTVHIAWGKAKENDPLRVAEIQALAGFLERRSEDSGTWSTNLILLGDFNIFSQSPSNQAMAIFAAHGFVIPEALQNVESTNVGSAKRHYDQIALKVRQDDFGPTGRAGVFDFFDHVYRDVDYEGHAAAISVGLPDDDPENPLTFDSNGNPRDLDQRQRYYRIHWRRRQMSDHLPMWMEMKIDHGAEYLSHRAGTA